MLVPRLLAFALGCVLLTSNTISSPIFLPTIAGISGQDKKPTQAVRNFYKISQEAQ